MRPGNRPKGPCPTAGFEPLFLESRPNPGATILWDGHSQVRRFRAFLGSGARMQVRLLQVAIVGCLLAVQCRADQAKAKVHHAPAPVAAAALPVAPAPPLRPEQMPASPPQVNFHAGQLTINAQNSTLGDILRAVRNQTGAAVDVPANATERVAGNFGPGPARDVLSSLLNGSHFNYVLLGSATNPDTLDRVILTLKSGVDDQPAATATDTASAKPPVPGQTGEMTAEDQASDQAQDGGGDIFGDDSAATPEDQAQNAGGQPTPNVRTPEQMLQDMQNQQQAQQQIQQRQQQMGINPGMQIPRVPPGIPQPPQPNPQ
jgi:hypothetical protein